LIYSILIAYLLLIPSENISDFWLFKLPYFDKTAHFLIFAFLYLIWFITFLISRANNKKGIYHKALAITVACILYSIILETFQYFISYRNFDVYDIAANVTGTIFATFLSYKRGAPLKSMP